MEKIARGVRQKFYTGSSSGHGAKFVPVRCAVQQRTLDSTVVDFRGKIKICSDKVWDFKNDFPFFDWIGTNG